MYLKGWLYLCVKDLIDPLWRKNTTRGRQRDTSGALTWRFHWCILYVQIWTKFQPSYTSCLSLWRKGVCIPVVISLTVLPALSYTNLKECQLNLFDPPALDSSSCRHTYPWPGTSQCGLVWLTLIKTNGNSPRPILWPDFSCLSEIVVIYPPRTQTVLEIQRYCEMCFITLCLLQRSCGSSPSHIKKHLCTQT